MDSSLAEPCMDDATCRCIGLGILGGYDLEWEEAKAIWGNHLDQCSLCQERVEKIFHDYCDQDHILSILNRYKAPLNQSRLNPEE